MLLVICGLITLPSLALVVFLTGWVQYVFAVVVAINVAVPVLAFLASLNPPRQNSEQDYACSRAPQTMVEDTERPLNEQVPVAKVSDKV